MNNIVNFTYFGEICALSAALCWSIAVIIFKSASKTVSPFLIVPLKNTIAILLFILFFIIFNIPIWHSEFTFSDYMKIIISGSLGMGFADVMFIYALSKIGANRIAIVNCFEPAVIYFFSIIMLGSMLTFQQLAGFIIVIVSLLIISYERDQDDIDSRIKNFGLILQISAILLSSFGIVLIKPVLSKVSHSIELQLWVTFFRLLPGFFVAWLVFLFQKNKYSLFVPLRENSGIVWKILVSSGLGTFVALGFWIIAYANIEKPPITSIICQTSVLFITILSWLVLKEHISKIRVLSMIIAIAGVVLIILK